MSEPVICAVAVAILGVLAMAWLLKAQRRQACLEEWRSRPSALRDARLIHIEKRFTTTSLALIAAKPDRVYRMPSEPLALVELKTRWSGKLSFSHVVQLPARRVAVKGSTVQPIASEAFVGVRRC